MVTVTTNSVAEEAGIRGRTSSPSSPSCNDIVTVEEVHRLQVSHVPGSGRATISSEECAGFDWHRKASPIYWKLTRLQFSCLVL